MRSSQLLARSGGSPIDTASSARVRLVFECRSPCAAFRSRVHEASASVSAASAAYDLMDELLMGEFRRKERAFARSSASAPKHDPTTPRARARADGHPIAVDLHERRLGAQARDERIGADLLHRDR